MWYSYRWFIRTWWGEGDDIIRTFRTMRIPQFFTLLNAFVEYGNKSV